MSFSSNLKALQSMALCLDSISDMLLFEDILLEDYFFLMGICEKISILQKQLERCGIVLEIHEDTEGRPTGHRLYVEKPGGGQIGITTTFKP